MLMLRAKPPADWVDRVVGNIPAVLVDHAHLERKAATSAISLQKYPLLRDQVLPLTAIAIEELQHFELVMGFLNRRGIPLGTPFNSPWIRGLMQTVRTGRKLQAIDHLLCAALIEGRSCEKFMILQEALRDRDPELSAFYGSLVESEGNHYATYILMARGIDEGETDRRLDHYLDLDAELVQRPHGMPILH